MLRKAVPKKGKDWDKLLPYLLFAYREVPLASTGFSPFELLYGRAVRGPLDVLRETWEADKSSGKSVVSYLISTQEKLQDMAEIVKENLTKAQLRQKQWYDRDASFREFKAGDPVLVLLPTSSSKLLAQWQGPYQVGEQTGKVTYRMDMHDNRKRRRVFHIIMLKAFRVRRPEETNSWTEEVTEEDSDADVLNWKKAAEGDPTIIEQVTEAQKIELQEVLKEFANMLQQEPGRTTLAQHHIDTGNVKPVRLPPYRLPHDYREQIRKELNEMLESGITHRSKKEWDSL